MPLQRTSVDPNKRYRAKIMAIPKQPTCRMTRCGKRDRVFSGGFHQFSLLLSSSSSRCSVNSANDDHLIAKTPSVSRTGVLYKFSSDYALRERYRNPMNEIRIEKLLEDMDALAGTISYKLKSLTLVTASVENVILKKPICIDTDLTIEGAVTWVGCSSLEIQLHVKHHPSQSKNIHGQIFGGYLMRKAYELAYATAYSFVGSPPCFVQVDHVDFLKLHIGEISFHLNSCVLYTQVENSSKPLITVEVVAHVTQPQHCSTEVSNNFYFTFTVCPDTLTRNSSKIRNVVPATEEEARG
ncbi:Acyl-coenzyme A thioesterase 9, mitochondrial [Datura stramonium]|uniref:Acyl-coenzyme A thioesterase 9, mitochondrial n=1 Tax=Datura stramonium TaxID=4076 RepID=A0ABS8ULW2_DATST|nr:Acyl-coenzyme A thioesterase 9, mitochondrial [Datura stramonium]